MAEPTQRILVVEDDPSIQRVIELCLEQPDRVFDLRADGESGLAAAGEERPDLVILDLALPGIDGWEVLRGLRHRADRVSVLLLTALGGPETAARAKLEGADGFIAKPFRITDLRRAVDALVVPSAS